jgi:hypothetical protein
MKMKKYFLLIVFGFCSLQLLAQVSSIENTRVSLSKTLDSLIVHYSVVGEAPVNNVRLEVIDTTGNLLEVKTVYGDVGDNILPGDDKMIIWHMAADGFNKQNMILNAMVVADLVVESFYEKEVVETPPVIIEPDKEPWVNWWFVAAGASATAGVLSYLKSNSLYDDYGSIANTNDANNQHAKIKDYDLLGNIAFGLAGAFGVTGVIVQVKHNKEKKELAIQYRPVKEGAGIGLVYKF